MKALDEGLAHADGGEVVIRSGEAIGHIYLHKGSIAWVNCSRAQARARDTLLAHSGISAEELDAALEESQRTRRNLAETLLGWGLIEPVRLWQCLRLHNARHLNALGEMRDELQAIFVPQARTYSAGVGFSLDELLESLEPSEEPAPEEGTLEAAPALEEAAPEAATRCALERAEARHSAVSECLRPLLPAGALAGALLDLNTRHVCRQRSRVADLEPLLAELTARLMDVLIARSEPPGSGCPREVMLVGEDTVHVLRRCEAYPSVYLWLMFDASTNVGGVLAHCHLTLKALEQELSGTRQGPSERGAGEQP